MVAAFPLNEVLTSHALGDEASLQRPRMHRELVGDGVRTALAGGPVSYTHLTLPTILRV